ncbi:hypothetical protein FXO38_23537 [Capsicum annuum]|nr:hypothetical protein FXO38_23537 [Capsicum annuum]
MQAECSTKGHNDAIMNREDNMQTECSNQGNTAARMTSQKHTNQEDNDKSGKESTKDWVSKAFVSRLQKEISSPVKQSPAERNKVAAMSDAPNLQQNGNLEQSKCETNVNIGSREEGEKLQNANGGVKGATEEFLSVALQGIHDGTCNNQAGKGNSNHRDEDTSTVHDCTIDGGSLQVDPHVKSQDDSLALMEIPIAMQIDESQLIRMESPNRILHEIVSHNFGENTGGEIAYQEQIAKGITESELSDDLLENILIEADLSPRYMQRFHPEAQSLLERLALLLCVGLIWAILAIVTVNGYAASRLAGATIHQAHVTAN